MAASSDLQHPVASPDASNAVAATPEGAPPVTEPRAAALLQTDLRALVHAQILRLEGPPPPIDVWGPAVVHPIEPLVVADVVRHLLQDAAQATPAPGRVQVELQPGVRRPTLRIRDGGSELCGEGLLQAGPLARSTGIDLRMTRVDDLTEVRLTFPEVEASRTVLVVAVPEDRRGPLLRALRQTDRQALIVDDLLSAAEVLEDQPGACGAVVGPRAWDASEAMDLVRLRCGLSLAPVVAVGEVPELCRPLVHLRAATLAEGPALLAAAQVSHGL
ncbi:MAG: hypothetical protein KTR31_23225 [Myxococcales bacterium]|nr:hypothetical protein [Myxococcales bacterium]